MKVLENKKPMSVKINISDTIKKTYQILKNSIFKVAAFEIIYNLILILVLKPIISVLFKLGINLSGYDALTNDMIFSFFTRPVGIIMGLIFLCGAIVVVYYEFSVVLILLKAGLECREMSIGEAAKKGMCTFKSLFSLWSIGFAGYTLVLMPFLNMGIHTSLIRNFEIPNFVLEEILKYNVLGVALILLIIFTGIYFFTQAFYVLPLMVFEEKTFYNAYKKSKKIIKGNKTKLLIVIIVSTIVWGITTLLIAFVNSIFKFNMATLNFKILFAAIIILLEIYASPLLLSVIMVCYKPYESDVKTNYEDEKVDHFLESIKKIITYCQTKTTIFLRWLKKNFKIFFKKYPTLISVTTAFLILFSTLVTVNYVAAKEPFKPTDYVVGHRGSKNGVENSIEAVMSAYEDDADYVEIDVLLSKDGVPMVIHDFNLFRLTSIMANIYDYTKDELQENFIQKQNGYTSKIITLEELCVATKGKIKLLIELKSHGKEKVRVSDKAVEIIEKYEMENEVKFLSTEYNLVKEMKTYHKEYETGYIIVSKLGNISARVFRKLEADFYGIEETVVDESIIKAIHSSGKPVFIWTVNDVDDAKKYFSMGVDGIITDYPKSMIKIHEKYVGREKATTMFK